MGRRLDSNPCFAPLKTIFRCPLGVPIFFEQKIPKY